MKRLTRSGFSLVEIALALGIAGFCLTALFGLLPIGINSNQTSVEQTAAAGLATTINADLRGTPASTSISPRFGFKIPAAGGLASSSSPQTLYLREDGRLSSGKKVGDPPVSAESRYRASVGFTPPGSNQRTATFARIVITWPALADPAPTQWATKYSGSFEIVTTLNRN